MQSKVRMPAEWEPHQAMWLAMPHNAAEWGAYFAEARRAVMELANALEGSEPVQLLVHADEDGDGAGDHVTCHRAEYGDIWLRDTGPIFVERNAALEATRFAFNGWGGKYRFEHDDEVGQTIATIAGVAVQKYDLIAEGGALDGNGAGTFLSTQECLLNPNRNPGASAAAVEETLRQALGCRKLIWIDRGLSGDHTDGHIDNLARFVAPNRVFCMTANGAKDPNAEVLGDIQRTLADARSADGERFDIVTVPSPGAVEGPAGLMAASYCNFLIANQCVIVPTFGVPADAEALATLAELFPERRIVPLDAFALLTGGGTVHCISQQEPRHVV